MVTITSTFSKEELLKQLTPENPLILFGVRWEDYEKILTEFQNVKGLKIYFNRGILRIMSNSLGHEIYADLIKIFLAYVSKVLGKKVSFAGSTTLKKTLQQKGAQPDAEFYVTNASAIKGKKKLDLSYDLPPDVVVEIDVTHSDEDKFEIYATFGVPEFWVYDEKNLKIYRLQENKKYTEVSASIELPILTAEILTEFLNRSQTEEQFDVLNDFENWLNESK